MGHPIILPPVAILLIAVKLAYADSAISIAVFVTVLALGALMIGYSLFRTRRGDWKHIDASRSNERKNLNAIGTGCLLTIAALYYWSGLTDVAIGFAAAASVMICAIILRNRLNLSLHVGYAAFATALLWQFWFPMALFVVICGLVAWSRLTLGRHSITDIGVGGVIGAIAGAITFAFATGQYIPIAPYFDGIFAALNPQTFQILTR